ncbi:hypothetical protein QTP88_017703 [Uroleucon formosanum]
MGTKNEEDQEFWCEFLLLYQELPELWKIKSEVYKNRNKKNAAYDKMVEKMKEIEPKADRAMVHTKINALRTSYRRELKKVKSSIRSGAGTDVIYKPNLWYYNKLDFLRDQEGQTQGISAMDDNKISVEMDQINETEYWIYMLLVYVDNSKQMTFINKVKHYIGWVLRRRFASCDRTASSMMIPIVLDTPFPREKFRRISFEDTEMFRPGRCCKQSSVLCDFQSAFSISPVVVDGDIVFPRPSEQSSPLQNKNWHTIEIQQKTKKLKGLNCWI